MSLVRGKEQGRPRPPAPECYVCRLMGERRPARYVAYIIEQCGPVHGRLWELVCAKHKRKFPAFTLVPTTAWSRLRSYIANQANADGQRLLKALERLL